MIQETLDKYSKIYKHLDKINKGLITVTKEHILLNEYIFPYIFVNDKGEFYVNDMGIAIIELYKAILETRKEYKTGNFKHFLRVVKQAKRNT